MSRRWADIPRYEKEDPTWGLMGCGICEEYEGNNHIRGTYMCDRCYRQEIELEKLAQASERSKGR